MCTILRQSRKIEKNNSHFFLNGNRAKAHVFEVQAEVLCNEISCLSFQDFQKLYLELHCSSWGYLPNPFVTITKLWRHIDDPLQEKQSHFQESSSC